MAVERHKWVERNRDHERTQRQCMRCGLWMITRHEPANFPPHWTEWQRNGGKPFSAAQRPACEPIPHPSASGSRAYQAAGDAGRK
jgi:hypothetical protein